MSPLRTNSPQIGLLDAPVATAGTVAVTPVGAEDVVAAAVVVALVVVALVVVVDSVVASPFGMTPFVVVLAIAVLAVAEDALFSPNVNAAAATVIIGGDKLSQNVASADFFSNGNNGVN